MKYEKSEHTKSIQMTGRLIEVGDDDNRTPRIVFETTREELIFAGKMPLYIVGATLQIRIP